MKRLESFFRQKLKENISTVIITHFCPHLRSLHDKYCNSSCNSYFITDCSEFLGTVPLWIHGHTHSSFDYQIENTRVICNPRGYHTENKDYNNKCVVEI